MTVWRVCKDVVLICLNIGPLFSWYLRLLSVCTLTKVYQTRFPWFLDPACRNTVWTSSIWQEHTFDSWTTNWWRCEWRVSTLSLHSIKMRGSYRVPGRNPHVLPYQKYGDRGIYVKYSTPQNFLKTMSGTSKRFKTSHWERVVSTDPDSLGYDNSREKVTCRGCKSTICLGRIGPTVLFHPWFHHKLRCVHLQWVVRGSIIFGYI